MLNCTCGIIQGHFVVTQAEDSDRSYFLRLRVWGTDAPSVLADLVREQSVQLARQHGVLPWSSGPHPAGSGWWSSIIAIAGVPVVKRPVKWSPAEVERLRAAYMEEGMLKCIQSFPDRTYDAIACAMRRYRVRDGVKRELREA